MNDGRAVCFDVYYYGDHARACCLVFETKPAEAIIARYSAVVKPVSDYFPGKFYRRELPCILRVYERIEEEPDLAIVDGYVSLGEGEKGLGGYLFEALDGRIAVIGVAKTLFRRSRDHAEVYRGGSQKPLYVSTIGVDLDDAAAFIENLAGKYRIPDILREVDRLSRAELQARKDRPGE